MGAAFAGEAAFQHFMGAVQVTHVAGGIFLLRFGKLGSAPVAGLLLLGDFHRQRFLQQILQPVAIRVGAHQFRCDLGAEHRGGPHAQELVDHRHVEPGEVHQFQAFGISQHRLQIGRIILAGGKAHEMFIAVAIADLQQAQPVAVRVEAHGLAVHGHRAGCEDAGGTITFVKIYGHGLCVSRVQPCCHPP